MALKAWKRNKLNLHVTDNPMHILYKPFPFFGKDTMCVSGYHVVINCELDTSCACGELEYTTCDNENCPC